MLVIFGITAFILFKAWGLLAFVIVTAVIRKFETSGKPRTYSKGFDFVYVLGYLFVLISLYFTLLLSNFMTNFKTELEVVHNARRVTSYHDQIYAQYLDPTPPITNISTPRSTRIRAGIREAKGSPTRMSALYGTFILGWFSYIFLHSFTRLYRQNSTKNTTEKWGRQMIKSRDPSKNLSNDIMRRNGRRLFLGALLVYFIYFIYHHGFALPEMTIATKTIRSPVRLVLDIGIGAIFLWYLDRLLIYKNFEKRKSRLAANT